MSLIRNMTRQSTLLRSVTRQTPKVAFASPPRRLAHQDYGGSGIAGEKPETQGKNPSEDKEHPGPPSPADSNNSGSSGQQKQQQGGNSSSQQPQKTDSSSSKGTQGAQPKILNESPPKSGNASQDVEQHNREMDQRAEKANEKVRDEDVEKDKVGKGFWSGHGGADRQP